MSNDVLSKKIEVFKSKPIFKSEYVDEVIVAAERSKKGRLDGVSNVEARAVADLFVFVCTKSVPATSAKSAALVVEDGVVNKFDAFFMAHQLPYGKNKRPMKEHIEHSLEKHRAALLAQRVGEGNRPLHVGEHAELGFAMPRAPRTGSLQPVRLTHNEVAYVDAVKKQFVVKVKESDAEPTFYGPFGLAAS